MKLLLSGPPASGKSRAAMEYFQSADGSYLVTPTSTMAEHLRHGQARSGAAVRPARITTLAHWLDSWDLPAAAPAPLVHLLIEDALERLRPQRFESVREFPGFHAAAAELLEEAGAAAGGDLAAVFREVEAALAARGFALRNARLRAAAKKIRSGEAAVPPRVVFDGFFTLASAELELIDALAARTGVIATLPGELPGFAVRRFTGTHRTPARLTFCAATAEREAEEIARRILEHSGRGRPFREMGIVLRSRDPYGPVLEAALKRFGVPFRAYFSDPAAAHPAVAFLSGVVNACLDGWDHAAIAALLRMPVSGVGATPAGDHFDFLLRARLPGRGLPLGIPDAPEILDTLARMDARRLEDLARLIPPPQAPETADRDQIQAWRSTAAALRAFQEALDQTAEFFPGAPKQFWKRVQTVLGLTPLRIEDRRRDVVHLMDVYEARQWELPVVFVCGLLERDFPRYHSENPLLGDEARRRLGLATSAQRQQEERFLFDLAVTRATAEVVLSYSRSNEKGEETLPSFFLGGEEFPACELRVRPKPLREVKQPPLAPVQDQVLLERLAAQHRKLSATGLESFLQCPFQFFAQKTLRLRPRPPEPRDRLNALLKGSILHRALAEWASAPLLGSAIFDRVFEEECARQRIPPGYRTEAARLELLRHFEGFLANTEIRLGERPRVEEQFEFALNERITIRGRIDRLEVDSSRRALVIDYKYSAGNKIRERVEESEAGNLVQGGLYLLAAERVLGLEPAGMLFCGLKKDVTWGGWHIPLPGLSRIGESCTPERLRDLMQEAAGRASSAYESITAGQVAARPADRAKCRWCEQSDICRVETIPAASVTGAGG